MHDLPRHAVLLPRAAAQPTSVVPLPPAARIALRVKHAEAHPPAGAAGFDLSGPINSVRGDAARFAARLGPDEWLLVEEGGDADAITAGLSDLYGRFYAATDVSHRNAALAVCGPDARAVLNGGVPLDLDDAAFPEGTATRTHLGKAEIVLLRIPGAAAFRVEVWRSFAPYVDDFLREVAQEYA